jgi:DNA polymerase-1
VIDASCLSYRALYSFSHLGYNSNKDFINTGIIYGFLKDILNLKARFISVNKFSIAWDTNATYRKSIFPEYKNNRDKTKDPEFYQKYLLMVEQMKELEKDVFPSLGINQYKAEGHEADDVIATLAEQNELGVIISGNDKDYFQLLDKAVLYNFNTLRTIQWFRKEYGLEPERWIDVQILAGDKTDNIPGINGIGIKTAVSLIRTYGNYQNFLDKNDKVVLPIKANISEKLVRLRRDLKLKCIKPNKDIETFRNILKKKQMFGLLGNITTFDSLSRR